jgi:hypothetical protein
MSWYRITCWRCRGQFDDPSPAGRYCSWCAAPSIGMRGDGQYVQHEARRMAEPQPLPQVAAGRTIRGPADRHAGVDENGELPILKWRLRSSTTGKTYTTRHKLTEACARGIDPDAQPVGEPSIIRRNGDVSTTDYMGAEPVEARRGAAVQPREGPLPGWRKGDQHQWSRDPGRGRRYR